MPEVWFDLPRLNKHRLGMNVYIESVVSSILKTAPPNYSFALHTMGLRFLDDHEERLKVSVDPQNLAKHFVTRLPESANDFVSNFPCTFGPGAKASLWHSFGTRSFAPRRAKMIVTVQDVVPIVLGEGGKDFVEHVRKTLSNLINNSQAVITISEFSKAEIAKTFSIDSNKIVVIPNGLDVTWFKPLSQQDDAKAEQHLCKLKVSAPYLLCLGGATARKNLERMLEGFCKFKKEHRTDHQLVISGHKVSDEFATIIAKLGLADSVNAVGYVSSDEALALLQKSQGLVFPSIYEGFGMPPLEAMACAVPVASSTAASLPEVVGDAGVYFDPLDTDSISQGIAKLALDASERSRCIAAGLLRAQTYSWLKNAEQTIKLYEKVLSE